MPRHLRSVDELGPSEVHVGALASRHVGLMVVVRRGRNVLAGRLMGVPSASMTKPLLVLQVGDFPVALDPTAVVLTVPDGCKATVTVTPQRTPARSESGGEAATSAWVVGDAINGERSMELLPGRWRNRRKCYCGCGGKSSHGGYAGGLAMTSGCEWAMRYWVNHGQLPTPDSDRPTSEGTAGQLPRDLSVVPETVKP
jgi:hypothetical protein